MLGDFAKNFAYRLLNEPWDVLLVDYMRDLMTGFIRTSGTYVTELNEYVEGEPIDYLATFVDPYEIIDWKHPEFFDEWTAGVRRFYDLIVIPMLDQGRTVVVPELIPALQTFSEHGFVDTTAHDADAADRIAMARRMHAYVDTLDARVIRVSVEDAYHVGVFDSPYGAHFGHKIADYYNRLAEKIMAATGMADDESIAAFGQLKLQKRLELYQAGVTRQLAIEQKIADLAAERDGALQQVEEVRGELACLEAQHAAFEERLASQQASHAALAETTAELVSAVRDASALAMALRADLCVAERRAQALQAEVDVSRREAERAAAERVALVDELSAIRSSLSAVTSERDALRQASDNWSAAHAEASATLSHERDARQAADARAASAEQALAALAADSEARAAAHEAAIQAGNQELDLLAREASGLSARLGEMRDEYEAKEAACHADLTAHETAVAEMHARLVETMDAIGALRRTATALEDDRARLKQQVDALLQSTSWRVTAPMRSIKSGWLKLRGQGG